jgi:uncharacterized membrane protein
LPASPILPYTKAAKHEWSDTFVTNLFLAAFWFTMVFHQTAMKVAALYPRYQWPIFIFGNVVAVGGTWFIMALHGRLQPHLVVGLCMGGGFLLSQIAMSILNRHFSTLQAVGALVITTGIVLLALAAQIESNRS